MDDKPLVIGECGFGFGLNFLLTCERFCQLSPENGKLHYLSCEIHPVLAKDLQRFYQQLPPTFQAIAEQLLQIYPEQGRGIHRLKLQFQTCHITLDLLYDPAVDAYKNLSLPANECVDAWYLDGHAPAKNEEMWDISLCRTIASLSKPGHTTFATYSVAGGIRRNLKEAGFTLAKTPGYGKKRHMLNGHLELADNIAGKTALSWKSPWPMGQKKSRTIGIVGAGLAGCASAYALANRGYKVTLIEKNEKIANGASGNARGIVHFNPGRQITPASLLRLNAFNYAIRHYQTLAETNDFAWNACGLIQLAISPQEQTDQEDLMARKLYAPEIMQSIDPKQATELANMQIDYSGLYFPKAGSLEPPALCQTWIKHKNIQLLTSHEVIAFEYKDNQWHVNMSEHGRDASLSFDTLVICDNNEAALFRDTANYPMINNHGQTDSFLMNEKKDGAENLKTVLRHQGYIIPWQNSTDSMLTIGGSFTQGRHQSASTSALTKTNLELIEKISLQLHATLADQINDEHLISRAGTRSTTPDYLPLAGPVEDMAKTEKIFEAYQRNARNEIFASAQYLPGLYINAGHGSSGLTTTPLLAEYLASLISNEVLPLGKEEVSAVLPLRYLIRNLKRQQ
jgi:tRNA 5-methylaminomethyl-2-thiouridine biosynthesis bifunctional protein